MFDNIGGKLKGFASFFAKLGIVVSCIIGVWYWGIIGHLSGELTFTGFIIGLLIAAGGSFASWAGSLTLYAFGDLVDNSAKTVALLSDKKSVKKNSKNESEEIEKSVLDDIALIEELETNSICNECGKEFLTDDNFCSNCGSGNDKIRLVYNEYGKCALCDAKETTIYPVRVIYKNKKEEIKHCCEKCISFKVKS